MLGEVALDRIHRRVNAARKSVQAEHDLPRWAVAQLVEELGKLLVSHETLRARLNTVQSAIDPNGARR